MSAGTVIMKRDDASLTLTEVEYPGGLRLADHAHENACFSIALRGRFTETYQRKTVAWKPFTTGFHPAGESHSNVIESRGARLFLIEPRGVLMRQAAQHLGALRDSVIVHDGGLALLGRKLHAELRHMDDVSTLAIEGLALEMTAEVARLAVFDIKRRAAWLERARDSIHASFNRPLTVTALAASVGVHPVHLSRAFSRTFRCSIGDYVRRLRIELACRELARTSAPLADIGLAAGFYDQAHFSRTFRRLVGLTPTEYRLMHRSR